MRIKLDENLPGTLVEILSSLGHDVDTVRDEGLAGSSDADVWSAAQQEGRFLITQDLDFSDVRVFVPGNHHGILLVRLLTPSRRQLEGHVRLLFSSENPVSWSRCLVIATETKLRIRRPS